MDVKSDSCQHRIKEEKNKVSRESYVRQLDYSNQNAANVICYPELRYSETFAYATRNGSGDQKRGVVSSHCGAMGYRSWKT